MNERDSLFLMHILEAIAYTETFVAAGRESFMADPKTQSAVVRQLEIIGEAVKNLSAALTARASSVPWRQIAGARDRMIHGCFKVDLDALRAMVEQDLPKLRENVQRNQKRRRTAHRAIGVTRGICKTRPTPNKASPGAQPTSARSTFLSTLAEAFTGSASTKRTWRGTL